MSSICFYAWNRNLHALRHSIVIHCCPGAAAAASAAGPLKQLLKNDHKRYGGREDRHLAGLCSTYDTIYEAHTIFMCHIWISGQFNSCDSVVVPAFIALLLGKVDEKLSLSHTPSCRFPLDAFALMLPAGSGIDSGPISCLARDNRITNDNCCWSSSFILIFPRNF